jgi:hypothetical protein
LLDSTNDSGVANVSVSAFVICDIR